MGKRGIEIRLYAVSMQPVSMKADQQRYVRVFLREARDAQSPAGKTLLLRELQKVQRKAIVGIQFRIGFPLPPAVVVLGNG